MPVVECDGFVAYRKNTEEMLFPTCSRACSIPIHPEGMDPFTRDEQLILERYFTNSDQPVFGLINLPEVVKGALFARYSRSPKSPAAAVPR